MGQGYKGIFHVSELQDVQKAIFSLNRDKYFCTLYKVPEGTFKSKRVKQGVRLNTINYKPDYCNTDNTAL